MADGDTLTVLVGERQIKVRLQGVDAPERGQPHGRRAAEFVRQQTAGQTVVVKRAGRDRYGRTVGEVILPNGRSLSRELVKNGYAWWYRHFSSDRELKRLEEQARQAKRGLWQDPDPIPPWEWRRMARRKPPTTPTIPAPSPAAPTPPPLPTAPSGESGGQHPPAEPRPDTTPERPADPGRDADSTSVPVRQGAL